MSCQLAMPVSFSRLLCLLFIATLTLSLEHALASKTGKAMMGSGSTLYVIGAAKETSQFLPRVKSNIYSITRLFERYKIVVYSDYSALPSFKDWAAGDSAVAIIEETYNHPSRTMRLAYARNMLLQAVQKESKAADSTLENSYLLVIDFDDVNTPPFNMTAITSALSLKSSWDVVSFNRKYYYDVWALRYDRFNVNVWNFGSQSNLMRDIIEADVVSLLNPNEKQLLAVYSAFNGIAFYKMKFTLNCAYNGANSEVFAKYTLYNHTRATIPEECEHVAFHRCISSKNHGRIRIYSGAIA